jgi:uncharacterized protein
VSGAPQRRRVPGSGDGLVRQGDRLKAYRPLPPDERAAALEAALEAYGRGDFFEAHELLEPAWMGTDDAGERALHQGLIKLAAGYVHAVRGNPQGLAKNLLGARRHLSAAGDAGIAQRIAVTELLEAIDGRLAALEHGQVPSAIHPPAIHRSPPR